MSRGSKDPLGLAWLFASASSLGAVSIRVLKEQRRIVFAPAAKIDRPVTTNVTVSASADGSLLASRRLTVHMYPTCIHESSRKCPCPRKVDHGNALIWGSQLCTDGVFGDCACSVAAVMGHTIPPQENTNPSPFYLVLVVLAALVMFWCIHQRRKRNRRGGLLDPDESALLNPGNAVSHEVEMMRGPGQRFRNSRTQVTSSEYVDASEMAE